jgi:hypothetical protein
VQTIDLKHQQRFGYGQPRVAIPFPKEDIEKILKERDK